MNSAVVGVTWVIYFMFVCVQKCTILVSYMNCSYDLYFADYYAVMPPYDMFLSLDKASRVKHFFQVNMCFHWYVKHWMVLPGDPPICGSSAPSGPWSPTENAFILLSVLLFFSILVSLGSVIYPSGRLPILFLVFPFVLYYEVSH